MTADRPRLIRICGKVCEGSDRATPLKGSKAWLEKDDGLVIAWPKLPDGRYEFLVPAGKYSLCAQKDRLHSTQRAPMEDFQEDTEKDICL
jgi:hypothetical protein